VPRDSTGTKARLVREAERLFARRGVYQVTIREITEAAEQRNVSAVAYHFGSREGVLHEILVRHGDPIDEGRGRVLAGLGSSPSTRDLVAALLLPYSAELATPEGRDYLRIVAQLSGRFATWNIESDLTPPHLTHALQLLEERPAGLPYEMRRERLVGMMMLMTSTIAERARLIEAGRSLDIDERAFLANLADMLVAVIEARPGAPLDGAVAGAGRTGVNG
jgi:AcrR family transcriptional regulator